MYYPHSKVIFVAINKSGSSSVLTALNKALYRHDVPEIWQKRPFLSRFRVHEHLKHAHAYFYRHYLGEAEFSNCFVFSQVRNPFDKVVSDFIFRCRAPSKVELWRQQRRWFMDHGLTEPTEKPDIRLFQLYVRALRSGDQSPHPHWREISSSFNMPDVSKSFVNQIDGLTDPQGSIIVDEIFRLEDLSERWAGLQSAIYRKADLQLGNLPHVNRSNRNEYKRYYDDETFGIVRELFQRDIDHFGYAW